MVDYDIVIPIKSLPLLLYAIDNVDPLVFLGDLSIIQC